jgi:hypothetical protein
MRKQIEYIIYFICFLFFMGIFDPEYHWPPPAPVGGGGESGGAGASGDFPCGDCPIISIPWGQILPKVAPDAGTLWMDTLYSGDDHEVYGLFYLDILYAYKTGWIIYHGPGSWDASFTFTSESMWHRPYTGAVHENRFYTIDDSLPGVQPRYGMGYDGLYRDGLHGANWLFWPDYQDAYLTGEEEWGDACFQGVFFDLITCIASFPLPWMSQRQLLAGGMIPSFLSGAAAAYFASVLSGAPSAIRRRKGINEYKVKIV